MKISKRIFIAVICTYFFMISYESNGQFRNIQRLLGKENPYVSEIKGDSIYLYHRTDTSLNLLEKVEAREKILMDLRVLNRNQAILETWVAGAVIFNLICIILIARIFVILRRRRS